jgi:ribosomal protein S18 acetylase RimI-like enzyme
VEIHIRIATQTDAAALARMIEEFNAGYREITITPAQAAARLAACEAIETTVIAEVAGQPAGFACLRLVPFMSGDEPYAELTDLFVATAYRRRGVGRALIAHIEQLAKAGRAADLVILTGFDNAAAQALYRAMGYDDYALALKREIR